MRLRDLVHIELTDNFSELRKLRKLPKLQQTKDQEEAATAADEEAATAADVEDKEEAATAADTHTSVHHRASTYAGTRVDRIQTHPVPSHQIFQCQFLGQIFHCQFLGQIFMNKVVHVCVVEIES